MRDCGARIAAGMDAGGVAVEVSLNPPKESSPFFDGGFRCEHGNIWYAQPTPKQIGKWVRRGWPFRKR